MVGQCHKVACKELLAGWRYFWIWLKLYISEFDESFIKNYNNESEEGYFIEVDFQYPENLHNLRNDSPFLPKRMKIEKVEKLVANLHDKNEYVIHKRNLKQVLNHGLALKKSHRVKPHIDMNTDLRKKAKNDFQKDFFKLMNNAVFGKTTENVTKHRDIKLETTKTKNYLVSEPYNNFFPWKSISIVKYFWKDSNTYE